MAPIIPDSSRRCHWSVHLVKRRPPPRPGGWLRPRTVRIRIQASRLISKFVCARQGRYIYLAVVTQQTRHLLAALGTVIVSVAASGVLNPEIRHMLGLADSQPVPVIRPDTRISDAQPT